MTSLPDGVIARMQFSPYRVQLAGICTSPVEFRPLTREIVVGGRIETAAGTANVDRLTLATEVFETDAGLLAIDQTGLATSEAFPGEVFPARVSWLAPRISPASRSLEIRLEIDNSRHDLRPGMFIEARLSVPLTSLAGSRKWALESWRNRTLVGLMASSLVSPFEPVPVSGLDALLQSAMEIAALRKGYLPAISESAVIDTGTRKVVFVEQSPGLFDAVEVRLGRRCGDFVPVLSGLEPGQAVVTAGAFLLDAETRLNPAAAAAYFGAGSRGGLASATPTAPTATSGLSPEDERLVKQQKVCPVTEQPLGSMGTPYRVVVDGRTLFLCCEGCTSELKSDPHKYLAKLPR